MKYVIGACVTVLVLVVVIALILQSGKRNKYQPTPQENEKIRAYIATHESSNEIDFTVSMLDHSFAPSALEVAKGDKVVIHLKGVEGIHTFRLDSFNITSEPIGASSEGLLTFVANKSGTYQFYSDRGDDKKNKMVGTLVVDK